MYTKLCTFGSRHVGLDEKQKKCRTYSFMTAMTTTADLDNLEAVLLNRGGKTALHERFRALFTLKSLKNLDAIRIITNGEFLYQV